MALRREEEEDQEECHRCEEGAEDEVREGGRREAELEEAEEEEPIGEVSSRKKQNNRRPPLVEPIRITPSIALKNPPPTKPPIYLSNVHAGLSVNHKIFGRGEVISIEDGLILVKFENGEKKFEFPNAFTQGFLHLE